MQMQMVGSRYPRLPQSYPQPCKLKHASRHASAAPHLVHRIHRIRWLLPPAARRVSLPHPYALPSKWSEVAGWSRAEFDREVSKGEVDLDMGRACLLIALEETAAIEMHPEVRMDLKDLQIAVGSMASASTWSLERLDSLAAEVMANFIKGEGDEEEESKEGEAAGSEATDELVQGLLATREDLESQEKADQQDGSKEEGVEDGEHKKSADADPAATSASSLRTEGHASTSGRVGKMPALLSDEWNDLVRKRPMRMIHALNTVLFDRHGYTPCNRYGQPTDARLSNVMETGIGCSAVLSVLYIEVSRRVGLRMAARPLEEGRYWVLWPENDDHQIWADGQRFVVDPYGKGGLLLASEVCELFEIPGQEEEGGRGRGVLRGPGSTKRELLAALLGDLRDSWWAKAVGCSAMPGSMTPLTLRTAIENKVVPQSLNMHGLERATSAATKRLRLLPKDTRATLDFALLRLFASDYDDVYIELGGLLERQQEYKRVQRQRLALEVDQEATCSEEQKPSLMGSSDERGDSGASLGLMTTSPSRSIEGRSSLVLPLWDPLGEEEEGYCRVLFEKTRLHLEFTSAKA